jgi:hypothetical protein
MVPPRRVIAGVLLLVLVIAPTRASAAEPTAAGRIKVLSGSVFVVRGDATTRAALGQALFEADTLRTGTDGRVGITLNDDTRVSLGPGSEARLNQFVYAPAEGRVGLVLDIVRGVIAYVSGRIAKLSPDSVKLETPNAIVGVRGTTLALRVSQ